MFGTYTTLISVSILNRLFSSHSSARTKSDKARTSELTASILLWRPYMGMVWNLQNSSLSNNGPVPLGAADSSQYHCRKEGPNIQPTIALTSQMSSLFKIPISRSIISFT